MSGVTVLGLGPMGRALAGAFVRAGHRTTVWNRTPGKADGLGAIETATAAEAIAASPLVLVCVIDYAAAQTFLAPAAGVLAGRTLVNLTSDTPEQARRMASWAAGHEIAYLDGAIMTPTPTIGGPDAVVLYSGDEAAYQRHQPTLAALGGAAVPVGAAPGRAAAHDMALLDLFWTSMGGLVHAFALARAEGIAARELAPLAQGIGALLPGIIEEFAQEIDEQRFPGDEATVRSAAAGIEHVVAASRARGLDPSIPGTALALARRAVESGHGDDSFSRLATLLTRT